MKSENKTDRNSKDLLSVKREEFWHLWRKRGLLLIALLLLVVPLYGTFSPLFKFILFAVSLAALTYPIFYRPVEHLGKKLLPNFEPRRRSELCAVEASSPRQGMVDTMVSIALGEEEGREALLQSISARIREIHSIYPRLPIDEEKTVQFVSNLVGDTREFSGTFLEFLFKGTQGFVAELALALIALSFLYAHGSSFLRGAMKIGGFEQAEVHAWLSLHRKITLRLLSDTVLTSLIRGTALALVAHFVGGFFFIPVFLLGAFVGLVPVVGSAMVWLPLSSLVWSRGEPMTALTMAFLSVLFNYFISQIRMRMGRRLHEQGAWLSFMLFLGIIGGILSYGPQGFVIGPMAVILAYGLVRFLANQSLSNPKV